MTQLMVELRTGEQLVVHRLNDEGGRPRGRRARRSALGGRSQLRDRWEGVGRGRRGWKRRRVITRRPDGGSIRVEDGPNLNRRGFFTATGGISIAALLAACGGSNSSSDTGGARRARRRRRRPARRSGSRRGDAAEVRPRHRDRPDQGLRVGRLRGPRDVGELRQGPVQRDVADEVHLPRERPAGAGEGRLGRAVRPDPPVHRVLAGLQGGRPDPGVRPVAAARLPGHSRRRSASRASTPTA